MSTCQPIYKTGKMPFFWYLQGSCGLSNPPLVHFFHPPIIDYFFIIAPTTIGTEAIASPILSVNGPPA